MDKKTIQFLRALVVNNMECRLDCGLDFSKPDEAQELYDYMTKCLLALVDLQDQEERL